MAGVPLGYIDLRQRLAEFDADVAQRLNNEFDNANLPRPALIARAVFQPGSPSRMEKLEAENTQLKERVAKLEVKYKRLKRMVSAMWDAPGMPGANARLAELYPDEQTK